VTAVVGLVLLLLFVAGVLFFARRANELFLLRARGGRFELVRGRLPHAMLSDLDDVASRARLDAVEVRAFVEGGMPRVQVSGPGADGVEQSLRNVVGRFQLTQIRSGTRRA
jgi:hypothetical protein